MSRIGVFALAGMATACAKVNWEEKLMAQVAMPRCHDVRIERVEHQDMWPDYTNTVYLSAAPECLESWRRALRGMAEYSCDDPHGTCGRFDKEGRYDEESATIRFDGDRRASVQFVKI